MADVRLKPSYATMKSGSAASRTDARDLRIAIPLVLLATMIALVDVLFFPGLYIPAVFYIVPVLLAAYFIAEPRLVAAVATWTIFVQIVAYQLNGAGLALLPTSYVLGLTLMSVLSVLLSQRVRHESRLRAELSRALEELDGHHRELQSQSEELQSQNEELQSQSEELHAQYVQLEIEGAERERLLAEAASAAHVAAESRAKLLAALESMTDAVFVTDAQGRFINFNEEFVRFYRFTSRAEVPDGIPTYPSFLEAYLPSGEPAPLEMWATFRALRGETVRDAEYTLHRKNTDDTWVASFSFAPIRDEDGMVVGCVVIGRDVTEQKLAEAERERLLAAEQQARDLAERALGIRTEFLSVAAHELKTPITSLRGFAQFLLRKYRQTASLDLDLVTRAMEQIDLQTRRLQRLTEELLDVSRLEAGKLAISREDAAVASVVDAALASIRAVHPDRTFLVEGDPSIHAFVDEGRLEQVVTNLVENAVKFSPSDAPVEITVAPAPSSSRDLVSISVRDYGPGVAEEERNDIFERFHQAHASEHYGGMGLGLYISAQIVALHGGTITCEQPLDGPGALFVVCLPVRP